jgi:hypothetical protein
MEQKYSKDIPLYQNPAALLMKQDYNLEFSNNESVYDDIIIDIHDSFMLDITKYDITPTEKKNETKPQL